MNERTHIDIFSGLGAWTIASAMLGIKTIAFCETDERCQSFLGRAWPGIPVFPDVRKLDGRQFRGVDLLTAGVPCQPASRGGDQRGAEDDRWLWGETLRLVREAKPRVVICENPPGIGDVGLCGILAELEAEGYEIAPIFDIPACALNSPQLRHRYYIVAYASESGRERTDAECGQNGCRSKHSQSDVANATESGFRQGCANGVGQSEGMGANGHRERSADDRSGHLANSEGNSERSRLCDCGSGEQWGFQPADHGFWDNYVWLPCADGKVRRAIDDTQRMAHGLPMELLEGLGPDEAKEAAPHRSLIGALGNSQVPQIAYMIIKAAMEALDP